MKPVLSSMFTYQRPATSVAAWSAVSVPDTGGGLACLGVP